MIIILCKINRIGQKFGKLLVIDECKERDKYGQVKYKCICDCGNTTYVKSCHLVSGHTKSCCCLSGKNHNKSHTRLYNILDSMKQRCYNSNNNNYINYGGRGITICDEWLNDFMAFYNWAYENGYDDTLTIDRIDNNKSYSPTNCRWVDRKVQANNTRHNVLLTYDGKTQNMKQWSKELDISYSTLCNRYYKGLPTNLILNKNRLPKRS